MLISKSEKSIMFNDAKILVFEITQTSEELLQQIKNRGWFETELKKFSSEKRKREFIAVRLAMKSLLRKEINISYDADGKPYLADNSYQISISHSGNWIAIIAHPSFAVGIDIECPRKKIASLYTRFLSEIEQEELSNGKDLNQIQLAWSAKEALFKIIGKQAVDFIKQLRIFPFEVKTEGEIIAEHIPTNTLYQLNYIQSTLYTLVYCLS